VVKVLLLTVVWRECCGALCGGFGWRFWNILEKVGKNMGVEKEFIQV